MKVTLNPCHPERSPSFREGKSKDPYSSGTSEPLSGVLLEIQRSRYWVGGGNRYGPLTALALHHKVLDIKAMLS